MRVERRERKTVEKEVVVGEDISCDLCGFDEDESYIMVVRVEIDPDGCAGTRITRDVCLWCCEEKLAPMFEPLFVALEAGEEKHEYRIEDEGDRWYG